MSGSCLKNNSFCLSSRFIEKLNQALSQFLSVYLSICPSVMLTDVLLCTIHCAPSVMTLFVSILSMREAVKRL